MLGVDLASPSKRLIKPLGYEVGVLEDEGWGVSARESPLIEGPEMLRLWRSKYAIFLPHKNWPTQEVAETMRSH